MKTQQEKPDITPYASAIAKVDDSPPRVDAGAKLSRAVIEGNLKPFYYVLANEIMRGNVNAFREIWRIGYERTEGNQGESLANMTLEQLNERNRTLEHKLGIPIGTGATSPSSATSERPARTGSHPPDDPAQD